MRKYVVASMTLLPLLLSFSHAAQSWAVDSREQPFAFSSEDSGTSSYLGVDISDVTTERLSALKLSELAANRLVPPGEILGPPRPR